MATATVHKPELAQPARHRLLTLAVSGFMIWVLLGFFARGFLNCLAPQHDYVVDFYQEWLAGRNISRGLPVYLPLREALDAHRDAVKISLEQRTDGLGTLVDVNVHPPTAVALGWPLSWLDYDTAFLSWNLLSLACFLASLLVVLGELNLRLGPLQWAVLCSFLIVCEPLLQQLQQGQWSAVLAGLVTFAWWADRHRRSGWAGAAVGVAAAIKLSPAFLMVYFILRRDVRAVVAALVTGLVLTALSVAVCGIDAYRDYLSEVLPGAAKWSGMLGNISLTSLWAKLFAPTGHLGPQAPLWDAPWLALLLTLASAVCSMGLIRGLLSRRADDLAFSATVVGMLLLSPVAWDHYALCLLVPLAVLAASAPRELLFRGVGLAAVVALWLPTFYIVFGLMPKPFDPQAVRPLLTLTAFAIPTYALVALGWLTWISRGDAATLGRHLTGDRQVFAAIEKGTEDR